MVFNPSRLATRDGELVLQAYRISSPVRYGKTISHPGIGFGEKGDVDTSLQLTGKPLVSDRSFGVYTEDYKAPLSHVVYNVIRDGRNIEPGYPSILKKLNLDNSVNTLVFQKLVFEHRLAIEGGLRYEGLE